jgi:hypothetical protein
MQVIENIHGGLMTSELKESIGGDVLVNSRNLRIDEKVKLNFNLMSRHIYNVVNILYLCRQIKI